MSKSNGRTDVHGMLNEYVCPICQTVFCARNPDAWVYKTDTDKFTGKKERTLFDKYTCWEQAKAICRSRYKPNAKAGKY